ncbi:hypothetical protein J6A31_07465 [bacterium]|nr:hypothetical protein [bacterium]
MSKNNNFNMTYDDYLKEQASDTPDEFTNDDSTTDHIVTEAGRDSPAGGVLSDDDDGSDKKATTESSTFNNAAKKANKPSFMDKIKSAFGGNTGVGKVSSFFTSGVTAIASAIGISPKVVSVVMAIISGSAITIGGITLFGGNNTNTGTLTTNDETGIASVTYNSYFVNETYVTPDQVQKDNYARQIYRALSSPKITREHVSTDEKSILWEGNEYLRKEKPFTLEAIIGMISNAHVESALDPAIYEGIYKIGPEDGTPEGFLMSGNHHSNWDIYCQALFDMYEGIGTSIDEGGYKYTDWNEEEHMYPGIGLWQWTGERAYNLQQFCDTFPVPYEANGDMHNDAMYTLDGQLAFALYENESNTFEIEFPIKAQYEASDIPGLAPVPDDLSELEEWDFMCKELLKAGMAYDDNYESWLGQIAYQKLVDRRLEYEEKVKAILGKRDACFIQWATINTIHYDVKQFAYYHHGLFNADGTLCLAGGEWCDGCEYDNMNVGTNNIDINVDGRELHDHVWWHRDKHSHTHYKVETTSESKSYPKPKPPSPPDGGGDSGGDSGGDVAGGDKQSAMFLTEHNSAVSMSYRTSDMGSINLQTDTSLESGETGDTETGDSEPENTTRTETVNNADGSVTVTVYDSENNIISQDTTKTVVNSDGSYTTTVTDMNNNVTSQNTTTTVVNDDGSTTATTVDANGNIVSTKTTTSTDSGSTVTVRDSSGNIISTENTSYVENPDGSLTVTVTDADGNVIRTETGTVQTIVDGDTTITVVLDANGNIISSSSTGGSDTTGEGKSESTETFDGVEWKIEVEVFPPEIVSSGNPFVVKSKTVTTKWHPCADEPVIITEVTTTSVSVTDTPDAVVVTTTITKEWTVKAPHYKARNEWDVRTETIAYDRFGRIMRQFNTEGGDWVIINGAAYQYSSIDKCAKQHNWSEDGTVINDEPGACPVCQGGIGCCVMKIDDCCTKSHSHDDDIQLGTWDTIAYTSKKCNFDDRLIVPAGSVTNDTTTYQYTISMSSPMPDIRPVGSYDGTKSAAAWMVEWMSSDFSRYWEGNNDSSSIEEHYETAPQYVEDYYGGVYQDFLHGKGIYAYHYVWKTDDEYAEDIISIQDTIAMDEKVEKDDIELGRILPDLTYDHDNGEFDNSSIASTAVAMAYPNGYTHLADVSYDLLDIDIAADGTGHYIQRYCTSLYVEVKDIVIPEDIGWCYSSCDRGVATSVRASGADRRFPIRINDLIVNGETVKGQINYCMDSTLWLPVYTNGHDYPTSSFSRPLGPDKGMTPLTSRSQLDLLQPGDLLLSENHVVVFVGPDAVKEKWPGLCDYEAGEADYAVVHSSRMSKQELLDYIAGGGQTDGSRGVRCDLSCDFVLNGEYYVFRCASMNLASGHYAWEANALKNYLRSLPNADILDSTFDDKEANRFS